MGLTIWSRRNTKVGLHRIFPNVGPRLIPAVHLTQPCAPDARSSAKLPRHYRCNSSGGEAPDVIQEETNGRPHWHSGAPLRPVLGGFRYYYCCVMVPLGTVAPLTATLLLPLVAIVPPVIVK